MKEVIMRRLRVKVGQATVEGLNAFIDNYETDLSDIDYYAHPLRWLIARYSRGDSMESLSNAYSRVIDKVVATQRVERTKDPSIVRVLAHQRTYAAVFRDTLVMASLGLCLHAPTPAVRLLLDCCERGEPLFESVIAACDPSLVVPHGRPAFERFFDGLYAAVGAESLERPRIISDYLGVWCNKRMKKFGFKMAEEGIGYWCFEAAGIVEALGIDDRTFRDHPHYPADLAEFHRKRPGVSPGSADRFVTHPTFGRGRVVESTSDNGEATLLIHFDVGGRKRMLERSIRDV
jgi:hypothetical protein